MKRVLITGFEAFLDHPTNPTQALIESFKETLNEPFDSLILPVEFTRAAKRLIHHIEQHPYDRIILLGLAAGRKHISLEHHALNLMHATAPDNAEVTPFYEVIDPLGPALYESTLPIKAWLEKAHTLSYPVKLSTDAGSYVCNDVFYRLRHRFPERSIGFIHIPLFEDLDLQTQTNVLTHLINL